MSGRPWLFKWRQFEAEIIICAVRWYLRYSLSYREVQELLAERGIDDVVVFGGGIIPDEDIPELERLGVARIFTPGATTTEIVDWVRQHLKDPPAPHPSQARGGSLPGGRPAGA